MWFVYIPSRKEINTKTNKMSLRHKDMFIPNFGGIIRSLCGFKSANGFYVSCLESLDKTKKAPV